MQRVFRRWLVRGIGAIPRAPPDRILGLTEQFASDRCRHKVNLTVGVYKDEWGQVTTLPSVAMAQRQIDADVELNTDLSYLPITGCPEYSAEVRGFLFGESSPNSGPRLLRDDRVSFAQTLSGTGALAVASKLLALWLSQTVWLPQPSWPNHWNVFRSNGFTDIRAYPYYRDGRVVVDEWLDLLRSRVGSDKGTDKKHVILLHACCHNPTGVDPSREQWRQILDTVHELGMIPVIDMAYQGLESGNPPQDAYVLRMCLDRYACWPNGLFVCQSFAKNMGLYGERVGSLSVVVPPDRAGTRENVDSQLKQIVRSAYSSPPGYGSRVATLVLSKPFLRTQWYRDVAAMVGRLNRVRGEMYGLLGWPALAELEQQHGMFFYTGLSSKQVDLLRSKYSVYMTADGRLSLSGVNDQNIEYVCKALKAVSETAP